MLDLVQTSLTLKQITFLRFDGTMTTKQKDSALTQFREDDEVKVLLVSLKCGSVGLNLTCANRVILLGNH